MNGAHELLLGPPQHGNKFGIADGDGNLSLWQASLASQCNRSFFVSSAFVVAKVGKRLFFFVISFCVLNRRINVITKE